VYPRADIYNRTQEIPAQPDMGGETGIQFGYDSLKLGFKLAQLLRNIGGLRPETRADPYVDSLQAGFASKRTDKTCARCSQTKINPFVPVSCCGQSGKLATISGVGGHFKRRDEIIVKAKAVFFPIRHASAREFCYGPSQVVGIFRQQTRRADLQPGRRSTSTRLPRRRRSLA